MTLKARTPKYTLSMKGVSFKSVSIDVNICA